jgi:hypothetical protein
VVAEWVDDQDDSCGYGGSHHHDETGDQQRTVPVRPLLTRAEFIRAELVRAELVRAELVRDLVTGLR